MYSAKVVCAISLLLLAYSTSNGEESTGEDAIRKSDESMKSIRIPIGSGANDVLSPAESKRLQKAISHHRNAVAADPNSANAHDDLGLCLFANKQISDAVIEFQEAIDIESGNALYHFHLAMAFSLLGQHDKCTRSLDEAIRLAPPDPNLCTEIGKLACAVGEFEKGSRAFSKVLDIEETPESLIARAHAYRRAGQFANSITDCNRLVENSSGNVASNAYAFRAYSHWRLKQFDDAVSDAERLIVAKDDLAYFGYLVRGGVRFAQQDFDASITDLNESITIYPENSLPYVIRALVWMSKGKTELCRVDLDKAISTSASPGQLNYDLDGCGWLVFKFRGLARLKAENADGAIADFDQAIKLNHRDAECYALRGWARSETEELKLAVDDLNQSLEISPEQRLARYLLSTILISSPDKDVRDGHRAIEMATSLCRETNYGSPLYLQVLAGGYAIIDDFESAAAKQAVAVQLLNRGNLTESYPMQVWWNSRYSINLTVDSGNSTELLKHYQKRLRDQGPVVGKISGTVTE